MIKTRIIPTLLFKDLGLVKGVGFNSWRRVGSVLQSVKVYNLRDVDELVFMDISATNLKKPPDLELVKQVCSECSAPLSFGGGIFTLDQAMGVLRNGADKVILNSGAISNPGLISEVSNFAGSQSVIVAIDAMRTDPEGYSIYRNSGTERTNLVLQDWAKMAESLGAGEIMITSIEKDGTMEGYDIQLIKQITHAVTIPVIASGGAGTYQHMVDAITQGKASAVAAASIFHFTQSTPLEARDFLKKHAIPVRN